jgi:hypothetical protein
MRGLYLHSLYTPQLRGTDTNIYACRISYSSGDRQVEGSCECGHEDSNSLKDNIKPITFSKRVSLHSVGLLYIVTYNTEENSDNIS